MDKCGILKKIITSPVYNIIKSPTPLTKANFLSKLTKNNVWYKREDLLQMFSFKLRGAYHKMYNLTNEQKKLGVVACSAGNHAQGVAFSANELGINATIVMPKVAPKIKVDSVKSMGANVIIEGDNFDQSKEYALELVKSQNKTLIHPYDDLDIIAGAGTIGMEILKQKHYLDIDNIFCSVGGGGLISGVGTYVKVIDPRIKIIGVEAEDGCSMTKSLQNNQIIKLDTIGTYADGAAVKEVGRHTFEICQNVVDEMVTVSNDEITQSIIDAFMDTRTILEPAGALAIAGAKKYFKQNNIIDSNNVIVTSGANIDFKKLRFISNTKCENEAFVSIEIPEQIGSFKKLYSLIYPKEVTEFSYRYNNDKLANILLGFSAQSEHDIASTIDLLTNNGYNVENLDNNHLARDHFKYSIITNPNSKNGTFNERLFRFHFPEFPGALNNFLNHLTSDFNITLFNYKNQGGDTGKVLVGMQVNDDQMLNEFLDNLGYIYFDETHNPIYKKFLL